VIEEIFRTEFGAAVATLVRLFGDIDVAEEAVQDAFVVAAEKWAADGIPPSPGGWIVTTAKRNSTNCAASRRAVRARPAPSSKLIREIKRPTKTCHLRPCATTGCG
jgi:RNA polymerase sigma-70 factor (ECF subfamily)